MHVLPIVTEYLDTYSTIKAKVLLVDRLVNIIDEGIDVAVRIGQLPDSGFTAIKVGAVRQVICGSPDYFQRQGVPDTPADLKDHRIAASTGAWFSPEWHFADQERVTVDVTLQCNTNDAAIAFARQGCGLTRVLHYQIGPALMAGDLQIVLSEFEKPPIPIHILHPTGRNAPAKVRTFVNLATARLRENLFLN